MPAVIMLDVIMLIVIRLSVVKLYVVRQSVIMLMCSHAGRRYTYDIILSVVILM
jgi:hypothetical protein